MPTPDVRIRVWDLPTRLFHWTLAAAVVGAVLSAKIGGAAMTWHFRLGLLVMGLLVFRLVWGLVGGRWSRFSSFVFSPATLLRYLRSPRQQGERLDVGHSPLGALSVFAVLAVLLLQVATGLVADDEIANVGPLNRFVAGTTALLATGWHKTYGQWLVISLAALHVAAIGLYYFRRKTDLVRPMIHGDKWLPADTPASTDGAASRLRALVLAALIAAGVVALARLGG